MFYFKVPKTRRFRLSSMGVCSCRYCRITTTVVFFYFFLYIPRFRDRDARAFKRVLKTIKSLVCCIRIRPICRVAPLGKDIEAQYFFFSIGSSSRRTDVICDRCVRSRRGIFQSVQLLHRAITYVI